MLAASRFDELRGDGGVAGRSTPSDRDRSGTQRRNGRPMSHGVSLGVAARVPMTFADGRGDAGITRTGSAHTGDSGQMQ